MKKKIFLIALVFVLALIPFLASCNPTPEPVPGASAIFNRLQIVGPLYYQPSSGGTVYRFNLPSATTTLATTDQTETLTNKTLTSPTLTGVTITGTSTIGSGMTLTSPTIAGGALSGTFTGAHTYSGTLTTTNVTTSVLTLTGTPVISNHASGNFTLSAGTGDGGTSVSHGLASAPARVFLSYVNSPGNNNATLYVRDIGATTFNVFVTANVTNQVGVNWLAYIADE